jgi:hypothetical protein
MPNVGRKGSGNHTQSVLFRKDQWTRARAVSWLKEHDYKADGFEQTESLFRFRQVDPEPSKFRYRNNPIGDGITLVLAFPKGSRSMTKELDLNLALDPSAELALDPLAFNIPATLELAGEIDFFEAKSEAESEDGKPDRIPSFFLHANTGRPMDVRGFTYPVIVDLEGAKFDKQKTPIIQDHETKLRIGHTTEQLILPAGEKGKIGKKTVKGPVVAAAGIVSSSSQTAAEYVADSKKGFPFQVSLGARIVEGSIVVEGDTVEVNGRSWRGPLIVAEKSIIRELTVTVLGADNRTSAKIAAKSQTFKIGGNPQMTFADFVESMGLSPDDLSEDQREKLQAHWENHQELEAARKNPPPLPKPPVKSAADGPDDTDPTPDDKLEAQRKLLADEEDRVDGIKRLAAMFADVEDLDWKGKTIKLATAKKNAIRDGDSPDAFELVCRRASYPSPTQFKGVRVENRDIQASALEVAVLRSVCPDIPLRAKAADKTGREYGLEVWFKPEVLEASDSPLYRSVGLQYMMDLNIQAAGMTYHGSRKSDDFIKTFLRADRELRASSGGFSTLAVANILENVANKTLLASYSAQETVWNQITGRRNLTDFKPHSTYRLTITGGYEQVGKAGELKHGEFSDQKFEVQGDTYGMMLALTRKDMVNDDLDAFQQIPTALGRLAALAIEFAVLELVLAAQGSGFFSVANNNLLTGAASDLTINGLTDSDSAFRNQVHDNKPILVSPDRILVGVQDGINAKDLFQEINVSWLDDGSTTERVVSRNPHVGKYTPIVSPVLNNTSILKMDKAAFTGQDGDQWYMFCNPAVLAAFVIGFLNANTTPVIESAESDFNTLGMQWRSYHDWGVAENEPMGAVKNAGK